jgi:arylsulfatase A-like enzyme
MTQTNILFFFPDQWRADWLGSNKDLKLRTPNIDKLQQAGMTFDKFVPITFAIRAFGRQV